MIRSAASIVYTMHICLHWIPTKPLHYQKSRSFIKLALVIWWWRRINRIYNAHLPILDTHHNSWHLHTLPQTSEKLQPPKHFTKVRPHLQSWLNICRRNKSGLIGDDSSILAQIFSGSSGLHIVQDNINLDYSRNEGKFQNTRKDQVIHTTTNHNLASLGTVREKQLNDLRQIHTSVTAHNSNYLAHSHIPSQIHQHKDPSSSNFHWYPWKKKVKALTQRGKNYRMQGAIALQS